MLRLRVFVFLLSIWSFTAFSQAKITVGDPYDVIDAQSKHYFTENGEIMTVKVDKKDVIIQKMSAKTLKFLKARVYDDFPKGFTLEQVLQFKDRYYLYYSLYEDKQEQLFARELDFAAGTFKGAAKKVLSITDKIDGGRIRGGIMTLAAYQSMISADKYNFYFSYDKSALIIQYRMIPETKRDSKSFDIIGMHVFDPSMKEKWGGKVTMPYTEKKMDNLDYSVDANGNVYLVARVYNDNTTDKKDDDDRANYKIEVMKIAAGTGKITSSKVDIADKFIQRFWLYETAQGPMIGAGYYNKGNSASSADGMILFKFNTDGRVTDMKTFEIPVDVLNQYVSNKTRRKNEKKEDDDEAEATNIILNDMNVQEDGSVILIGEQQYITTSTTRMGNSTRTTTTYHYNEILITKIDASGKLAWIQKLPKSQLGGLGQGGMSYRYLSGAGSHYVLFLDNEKNMNLPKDEVPARHMDGQGGFLVCYKLNDKTGEMKKTQILDTRDVQGMELFQFKPSRTLGTALNTLVFEAYKKKKEDVLVKVVLD
ncbi:hypothetical protein KK062_17045 [Fulvivirgaceae bacterium PWU5]|uniref:Uncharacterized protein n=1 Tax=Dawidia cretensis TaxID=2782350 RepID=A0AAP2DYG6_9BACT|nr:hypothetical protein [Dawidia cretensis]MBT1709955.1 hypothetical protein [Dawidia cretensis]